MHAFIYYRLIKLLFYCADRCFSPAITFPLIFLINKKFFITFAVLFKYG